MSGSRQCIRRAARAGALGLAALAAGCSAAGEKIANSELCAREDRARPIRVAHVNKRGEAFVGDAPRGEYDEVAKTIASALATPRNAVFNQRVRKDCYDKAKKVWYPCVENVQVDFSKVKGIARAPKMERARDVAITICELEVRELSPKMGGHVRFNAQEFRCEVIQEAYCPVFKASAEQQKEKKRLLEERRRVETERLRPTNPNCVSGARDCREIERR